jgi:tetratricopeptide (TPR) repeat protein
VRGLRERLGGRQKQAIACFEQAAQLAESQGARLWQADAEFEKGLAVREFEGLQSPSATTALNKALSLSRLCEAVLCERRILESLAEVG